MARHTERQPARPGFHTITPYVIVDDLESFLSFIKTVFDATETCECKEAQGEPMSRSELAIRC